MMYLSKNDSFIIVKNHRIKCTGNLSTFKISDTCPGFNDKDEMYEWLYKQGYRTMKEDEKLARLLLCLA